MCHAFAQTFAQQNVYSGGFIDIAVSVRPGGELELWEISLDPGTMRRIRAEGIQLAWRATGGSIARASISRAAGEDVSPDRLRQWAERMWEERDSGPQKLLDITKTHLAASGFTLPTALAEALEKLLDLMDDEEAKPVVTVRHGGGWRPWEFAPLHSASGPTFLGLAYPVARQQADGPVCDQRTLRESTSLLSPKSPLTQVLLARDMQMWQSDDMLQHLEEVRGAVDGMELHEPSKMTLDWLVDQPNCFCWIVGLGHLDSRGLDTGGGKHLQLMPEDTRRLDVRQHVRERLVLLAACEAALPRWRGMLQALARRPEGGFALVPIEDESSMSLAEAFVSSGADSVVAPLCKIEPLSACRYLIDLIGWLRRGTSTPVAVHNLRLQGGTLGDYSSFVFVCHGTYTLGVHCSNRGLGCHEERNQASLPA